MAIGCSFYCPHVTIRQGKKNSIRLLFNMNLNVFQVTDHISNHDMGNKEVPTIPLFAFYL